MSTERFEFAVVGEGQGGKTLAVQMALAGRKVAMIATGPMIGEGCIAVACIPTKTEAC